MRCIKNRESTRRGLIVAVSFCLLLSMAVMTGCGDSSSDNAADQESVDTKSVPEETTEAADPAEKFVGAWTLAAAESEGVTMSGDFGGLTGMSDDGMLKLEANGTGKMSLGKEEDEQTTLTWELKDDNTITLKTDSDTDYTDENGAVDIVYKDEALLMTVEEDEKTGTAIFTRDGKYPGALEINMEDAQPVTSEDELLGKWTMKAMNMMGISIYGSEEDLSKMMGGDETYINFKEGGVADMATGDGTWEVTSKGATLTAKDATGTHKCPIKKLGDDIVVNMSESLGGTEFLILFTK